ncbi:MAG: peptidoglycan DD-metalloendopeptidase family protein [Anaerolineales bacterium]|nr:peptidoglycan DD-metalloendopeptidase family protein [Anaerolineales bacterium]
MRKRLLAALLLIIFLVPSAPVSAQNSGPVYIVQAGDNLYAIAERFGVSFADLLAVNNITNANLVSVGQALIIPGYPDVSGTLDTRFVNFGDSYRSFMRQTQISETLFRKLNHAISPSEFYVGSNMIVPAQGQTQYSKRLSPAIGESLLELAVKNNTDVWTLSAVNQLSGTWGGLAGDVLYAPGESSDESGGGLPAAFVSAKIRDLPVKQGGTTEIIVKPAADATLSGVLADRPLHFFPMDDGHQVALQGIPVTLKTGLYPLRLDATFPDGKTESFEQTVLITRGDQRIDEQIVPPIDPATLEPETLQIEAIASINTPQKHWNGGFVLPIGLPVCVTEWFGTPRYFFFNNERNEYFHSGVDYGVCSKENPFEIFAAASGVVVFTGSVFLRGNATIIDNGWGVYTIYAHQEEIYVNIGQTVQAGEVIGKVGATGHVTGPHLHFEMWVGGVPVNGLDWLNQTYP